MKASSPSRFSILRIVLRGGKETTILCDVPRHVGLVPQSVPLFVSARACSVTREAPKAGLVIRDL